MKNEKFLVATMSERNKVIAKLKATILATDLDNLVVQAIDGYSLKSAPTMSCSYCSEDTANKKKSFEKIITFADSEHTIKILNYPINFCRVCEAEFDDLNTSLYADQLLDFYIIDSLRDRKGIPTEVDFEELIKMD